MNENEIDEPYKHLGVACPNRSCTVFQNVINTLREHCSHCGVRLRQASADVAKFKWEYINVQ
jgi:hypothetical protein